MNFIAIIGIVQKLEKANNNKVEVKIKIEKPFYRQTEKWFDVVSVLFDTQLFKDEMNSISEGKIIGVKGRICSHDNKNDIIGERLQVF